MSKKRILIIGPDGDVGDVRTHVDMLCHILKEYASKIVVTRGTPVMEILRHQFFFRPDVVVYNLSVYRNKIIRDMITRTILGSSGRINILHLHGGNFNNVSCACNQIWETLLKTHLRRFHQIFCLTNTQSSEVSGYVGETDRVKEIQNYVDIPDSIVLNKPGE